MVCSFEVSCAALPALLPQHPPPAPAALIHLSTKTEMQEYILHPLRMAIGGVFPNWILPVRLNVDGVHWPLHRLHEVFVFDYDGVMGPVLQNLQVQEWKPQFYEDEPDPTPPFASDTPRLDILVTFIDGTWLRWNLARKLIIASPCTILYTLEQHQQQDQHRRAV